MCPPGTPWMMWAGCLCVFVAVVSADSAEITVYGKLGGEVVLNLEGASLTVNSKIQWKFGKNIIMDNDDISPLWQDRVHFNTSNGALTIKGLTHNDGGVYTPTIDNNNVFTDGNPVKLAVISAVPVPTVTESCDKKRTSCTLTCAGNTTGAEPVIYVWRAEDAVMSESSVSIRISKEHRSSVEDFTCELKNNISQESSQLFHNPFFGDPKEEPKIAMGATVFVVLLTSVVLLVFFHRWKAGMWFFQKDSMPWKADFWRWQNGQCAAVSNGNPGSKQRTDEESSMT
ncbi:uncharacterized protein LOC114427244 [Parambassis ranga]|uniref:Uncharacterized protein LOC114427244 n=1 Tax=Parambassis ranga TaxID=210632 RepID=A0A6P7HK71_9TELE|nr:uncharacterized protein LOC114427244 [Parambassis ranga]